MQDNPDYVYHSFVPQDESSTKLTTVEKALLLVFVFFCGCCYNYMTEYFVKLSIDKHSFDAIENTPMIIGVTTILFSFSSLVSAVVLIFIVLAVQRFPFVLFSTLALVGQLLVDLILGVFCVVMNKIESTSMSTFFIVLAAISALFSGFFTALNLSTFFYLSSLISPAHVATYILGTCFGPFFGSILHNGWQLVASDDTEDLDIDLFIMSLFHIVSLALFFGLFFFSKHFRFLLRQQNEMTPTSLREQTVFQRTKSVIKATALQLKETSRKIVQPILSNVVLVLSTTLIYPNFLTFYTFLVDTTTAEWTEETARLAFLLKNICFLFNGMSLIGAVFGLVAMYRSKKTILVLTIERALFVIFPAIICTNFGAKLFLGFHDKNVAVELFTVIEQFITLLLMILTLFLGFTHGYLTFLATMLFTRHIDEKISANILTISLMLPAFVGSGIQSTLTAIFRSCLRP